MASKVEFHRLLYKIAQNLSQEEIDSLVFIEGLPVAFKGKAPFTVLQQMVLQGIISESKLEKLTEVLKGINRVDLAKEVKTKRSRKSYRRLVVQSDEQVSRRAIAANSEVALVQTDILLAQLDRLETVSEASQRRGRKRMINLVYMAKQLIESAERLLKTLHRNSGMRYSELDSAQSPSSDEEVRVHLPIPLKRAHSMDYLGGRSSAWMQYNQSLLTCHQIKNIANESSETLKRERCRE